jgi:myotubularin-related protein 6/7/8
MAGLRGNRSIQDEKLVCACFSAAPGIEDGESISAPVSRLEDEMISSSTITIVSDKPHIYGAQQHNLIVDARPTVNALAMQAVGLGSENMDHYKFATKAYLGIDNIHVMRNSLEKVIEAIKDSDISKLPPNREVLAKSGWLKHITGLLDGSALIARQVGIQHSHVLIHCSDGWDRTSQLSALSQLMLDPYYRTLDGFIVLVEKDWLAFGHMFQHRSGFLNSEKWFATQNDALAGSAIQPGGAGEGRGDAIENALLSAKRFFNKGGPKEETLDSDGEILPEDMPKSKKGKDSLTDKEATKPKETSPVFHQFLDATYQLLYQYPTRFEFNERFLRRLLYHLYSCQYGTFLYNNEKSRLDARVKERTVSVWQYFLSRRAEFINKDYDGGDIDDHTKGKERLIFPKLNKVRWWHEVFNRTDQDMNGPTNTATDKYLATYDTITAGRGVLTGIETATSAEGAGTTKYPANGSAGAFAGLKEGIAGLGIGMGKGNSVGNKSPGNMKQEMEVEMQ